MSPAISISALLFACSNLSVPFAVRLRSAQSVIQDVQVADHGQEECVVNADAVSDYTLDHRENSTADDSHIKDARSISRQRTKFRYSQAEDGGEHDGVEEPYGENRPHRRVPTPQHGRRDQCRCKDCAQPKQRSRLEPPQKSGAEKAS